jgi:hypothetical protein
VVVLVVGVAVVVVVVVLVVGAAVVVVVVVLVVGAAVVVLVVVVVVVGTPGYVKGIKLVHKFVDCTLTIVAASGIKLVV